MIRRNTWILLGLFGIVLLGAWLFQNWRQKTAATQPTPTPAAGESLFDVTGSEIASLQIESREGSRLVLGRDDQGMWVIKEPEERAADIASVEAGITQLISLRGNILNRQESDLSVYGLTDPQYIVTVSMNGGNRYVLVIGDITPTENGYYAQMDGGPVRVITKFNIDPMVNMFENPPYKETSTPEPTLTETPQTAETEISETSTLPSAVTQTPTP